MVTSHSHMQRNVGAVKISGNISRNGFKSVLVTLLKGAVANRMGSVENSDPNILSNMARDNFEPMTYCKLLAPDGDDLFQYEFNDVYGYQLRAPIASGESS